MCTKLLLDNAEAWCRATKSVQAHQNNVENKIYSHRRCTNSPMKEWTIETRSIESNIPAIPYGTRDCLTKNSQRYASSNSVQPPLPRLDLPESENLLENREESQISEPLCTDGTTLRNVPDAQNAQCTPHASGTCKSTHENFGKPAKLCSDIYL